MEYVNDRLPSYDKHCPSILPEMYNELVCKRCEKYFSTKAFLKIYTKAIHPNGRERIVQMVQEKEIDKTPEKSPINHTNGFTNKIPHAHYKSGKLTAINDTKQGMQANKLDNKYKRNCVKNSNPWE